MKSQTSSSSLQENLDEQSSVSSSHSDSYENNDNLVNNRVADNANVSLQFQNSMQSDDNNQISNEEKTLKDDDQSGKTNPHLNKIDSQKEDGARMIRSSRKIKKDYKNLSLSSKYQSSEQNESQTSACKKKKQPNQGIKQKKKKSEIESQTILQREGASLKDQYQQSRTSTLSQNQQTPHFKQFKNQIMQSISKYKSEMPPKMFTFLQKQQQINLNTLAKVSIHLPKNEEYLESIKNIQMVLADQETVIKQLVGAQTNQSLFDFLTKQKYSKKAQLAQQQLLQKQKQEEALKDNIEQLKQNLQYKINPQFIKSELKKEKSLNKQMSAIEQGKQSPQSSSKMGTSLSQQHQNYQNKDTLYDMEIENKQNISTEQKSSKIDNQQINIQDEKKKNNKRENCVEQKQQEITNQSDVKSEYIHEKEQQEGFKSQNSALLNSGSTKCSDETSKKNKNNSVNSNTLKNSTSSQKIPSHSQMVPPHPQYKNYGNYVQQSRHPLKQQIHPSENYYMHPHPYSQHPYPNHYRYLEQTSKQNVKYQNPQEITQNNIQPPSNIQEPLVKGDNQENIYQSVPNHPYYGHPYPHPGYQQYHYHSAHPMNNPIPYDYHVMMRNDQQTFHNHIRRNGSNTTNFYLPHYPPHPSQNSSYPFPDYQNNLGANFSQDMNDQSCLSLENNNQSFGYSIENNQNDKDQKSSKPSTQKKEDFFNELDENFEDSLSNFNTKAFGKNKKQKQTFDNDLDMDLNDQYSQNLMDFS